MRAPPKASQPGTPTDKPLGVEKRSGEQLLCNLAASFASHPPEGLGNGTAPSWVRGLAPLAIGLSQLPLLRDSRPPSLLSTPLMTGSLLHGH
jgi:hypothetical protein